MTNAKNPSNNPSTGMGYLKNCITEAREYLANTEDNHLVRIIAASLYMDDMGGVA